MRPSNSRQRIETDFIIVGSGVAGLRAALDLAPAGRVLILTKTELSESNSRYAQGGIAAAVGETDSVDLHSSDTLSAGAGLCDAEAVEILAREAPSEIERLIQWGTDFDRSEGGVALGREGAHSRARVLHAHGDATGKEIVRALWARVQSLATIRVIPYAFAEDLILDGPRVTGVRFVCPDGQYEALARAVLIASGGAGQVYRETTNPSVATGDGFALGYRAGALLRDMEFVQFHPTALKLPGMPPFLISEAVRGEGAYLIDAAGNRFVEELAPRDVVARAIYERIGPGSGVFLDLRHLPGETIRKRFPQIYLFCLDHGVDITRKTLPVVPAAHYFMGGLYTDLHGRTSISNLFAAGEAASTGVHGANRLASNSLLECVVFGRRAAAAMMTARQPRVSDSLQRETVRVPADVEAAKVAIREIAWTSAGIVRDEATIHQGLKTIEAMSAGWREESTPSANEWEASNLRLAAEFIMRSALIRLESRGAHFRTDYPTRNDAEFGFHSWMSGANTVFIGPPKS